MNPFYKDIAGAKTHYTWPYCDSRFTTVGTV